MILSILLIMGAVFICVSIFVLVDSLWGVVSGRNKKEQKKEQRIYRSISRKASIILKPHEHENGYYIDLNECNVSPSALFADYDSQLLSYYYEAWESFPQTPPTPSLIEIPFEFIIGFELKRRGETVFKSSAISSAATGYAFAGTIGAAVMSSMSERGDVYKHERDKRMDMEINIITSSPQMPLVALPITKRGPFSSASNEVIDQTTEKILAILQQIVTLNQKTTEPNNPSFSKKPHPREEGEEQRPATSSQSFAS